MKKKFIRQTILVFFLIIILAGCTSGKETVSTITLDSTQFPSPTIAVTITLTPGPINTPEPIVIQTQKGSFKIIKYGFQSSLVDWNPESGHRLLILWLEPIDGVYAEGEGLLEDSEEVYITGNDKSNTFRSICCSEQGDLIIGFTPPSSASTFILNWPGNNPIELFHPQQ